MWSFIKIYLICKIGIYIGWKKNFTEKPGIYVKTTPCHVAAVKKLSSFWLKLKQQWTIEEISVFSNSSHLWMEGGAVGHNFEMGLPKDNPSHICFNLFQRFQRRKFKCDLLSKYA